MALIKAGSINNFAVKAKAKARSSSPSLKNVRDFSSLTQVSKAVEPGAFELLTSAEPRAVALKKLELTEGFEAFMQNIFNKKNEIYFLAWAWDLSGEPIYQYPGASVNPRDVVIPLKTGRVKDFIGEGVNLFPKRKVKGGIAIRLQLWESDQGVRDFGKTMEGVADAVKKSELNNLLSLVSLATGVTGATVNLIKDASIEMTKIIGAILQANGDDYVDLFEGYYASDQKWNTGEDVYTGSASVITLHKY